MMWPSDSCRSLMGMPTPLADVMVTHQRAHDWSANQAFYIQMRWQVAGRARATSCHL
jgi:hypothetical protein